MDGCFQPSLGSMCYGGVPSMPQIADPHKGKAGRVVSPPDGAEVGKDVPERTTRTHAPCRETMGQNRQGRDYRRFLRRSQRQGFARALRRLAGGSSDAGRFRRGGGTLRRLKKNARKDGQRRERSADQKRIGPG